MSKQNDPQYFSSGYERNRLDRYWTHPWMTDELFRCVEQEFPQIIPQTVWECAAGRGDMSRAIAEQNRLVYSTDVDMSEFDYAIGPGHEKSFLEERDLIDTIAGPPEAIITNPPYNQPFRGIADAFVRKGLFWLNGEWDKPAYNKYGHCEGQLNFMAMLLRSEYRSGKSRRDMFGDCRHYMGELVLTTRPRWDYGDPDAPETAAPRHNFSWFLWSRNWQEAFSPAIPVQLFSYMPRGFKP